MDLSFDNVVINNYKRLSSSSALFAFLFCAHLIDTDWKLSVHAAVPTSGASFVIVLLHLQILHKNPEYDFSSAVNLRSSTHQFTLIVINDESMRVDVRFLSCYDRLHTKTTIWVLFCSSFSWTDLQADLQCFVCLILLMQAVKTSHILGHFIFLPINRKTFWWGH